MSAVWRRIHPSFSVACLTRSISEDTAQRPICSQQCLDAIGGSAAPGGRAGCPRWAAGAVGGGFSVGRLGRGRRACLSSLRGGDSGRLGVAVDPGSARVCVRGLYVTPRVCGLCHRRKQGAARRGRAELRPTGAGSQPVIAEVGVLSPRAGGNPADRSGIDRL